MGAVLPLSVYKFVLRLRVKLVCGSRRCPAFKILTYFGSFKERKQKRVGWTKANAFHVCITSYNIAVQDHRAFKQKKWKYLILDEVTLSNTSAVINCPWVSAKKNKKTNTGVLITRETYGL